MSNQPRQPKEVPPARGQTVGANEEGKPTDVSGGVPDGAAGEEPTGLPDSNRHQTETAPNK